MAYHPGLSNLYYNRLCFDVLCLFFYLAAFVCYGGCAFGTDAAVSQALVFLLLFLAALQSKEMAVTLLRRCWSGVVLRTPLAQAAWLWGLRRCWTRRRGGKVVRRRA